MAIAFPSRRGPKTKRHSYKDGASRFEQEIEAVINSNGYPDITLNKTVKLPYTQEATYRPDFVLPNGIMIEVKGWFSPEDRRKMKAVKEAFPDADIRIVFGGKASQKCYKGSDMTYADWCNKYGFPYAEKELPLEWLYEKKGGV